MTEQRREWANERMRRPRARQTAFDFIEEVKGMAVSIDMAAVDSDTLADAIASWTGRGYAITFGRTSDGGALGVHLLAGGEKRSRYFTDVAELENFLQVIAGRGGAESEQ